MTKKEYQVAINAEVDFATDAYITANEKPYNTRRLRTCNAFVHFTPDYIVLQSYNTVVAFIEIENGCCYDILRKVYGYTATSAQHIAKFKHDFSEYINTVFTWKDC